MADHGNGDTAFAYNGADIEDIFPNTDGVANHDQQAPPSTTTDESPDSNKAGFLAKFAGLLLTVIWYVIQCIGLLLFAILTLPFLVLQIVVSGDTPEILFVGYITNPSEQEGNDKRSIKTKKTAFKVKFHLQTIVVLLRLGCVALMWMVINVSVPSLRSVTLIESRLWQWSLFIAIVLLGYFHLLAFYMFVYYIVLEVFSTFKGSNVQYCMIGLAQSTILVLYFTLNLLAWLFCVDTKNTSLRQYGTLTLASFLVGAVLSVVKAVLLLWWKTTIIYKKHEGKILSAGCQLYIHLFTMDTCIPSASSQLVCWGESVKLGVPEQEAQGVEDQDGRAKRRKILPIEKYMLRKDVSIEYIHEVATCLTNNFELTLTEDDDIPDIVPLLRQKYARQEFSIEESVFENSNLDEFGKALLVELLQVETPKKIPTYEEFENWMVDGLKNCYAVGNRINGGMEVMKILDRVLTGLIVLVVILVWLFITGYVTTSVVVGLASMFLGLSFVFGDTCKIFFHGIIFSFVTHPFDVADRCIIDDKELKVKKINILTTTFFGSQSKEIVIYPNSDLATKYIILIHGEREFESKLQADPTSHPKDLQEDLIEFILPSTTRASHIKSLRKNIEGYLRVGIDSGHYNEPYRVILKEIGESIKMCVHFQHNLNYGSKGDKLETIEIKKDNQRSEFLLHIRELQENIDND